MRDLAQVLLATTTCLGVRLAVFALLSRCCRSPGGDPGALRKRPTRRGRRLKSYSGIIDRTRGSSVAVASASTRSCRFRSARSRLTWPARDRLVPGCAWGTAGRSPLVHPRRRAAEVAEARQPKPRFTPSRRSEHRAPMLLAKSRLEIRPLVAGLVSAASRSASPCRSLGDCWPLSIAARQAARGRGFFVVGDEKVTSGRSASRARAAFDDRRTDRDGERRVPEDPAADYGLLPERRAEFGCGSRTNAAREVAAIPA